jgi:cytochrome c oxidase subunit 1
VPTGLHHQYTDPGIPVWMKTVHLFSTMLIFFPSVITAFSVMSALEAAGRGRGGRGLFGWIRKLPWGDPSVAAQLLAMLVFLLGGASGLINASYTLNKVVHNTAFIPGHFHLTVGTAVALTIMGVSYWLVPFLTGHELFGRRLGLVQAWLYAIGVLIFARGQMAGGLDGMPRRTAIGLAPYQVPEWRLSDQLTALGGVLMTISGLLYFIVVVGTIVRARPARVEFPVAQATIGPRASWQILDRLGLWTAIACLLVVLAYGPVFIGYLPWNGTSPGFNTIIGTPVTAGFWPTVLVAVYVLAAIWALVAFWRRLIMSAESSNGRSPESGG